eukprot:gb/GFBE01076729.1/.p1 GENE.gb/GFBE01076729.1/~~gb/GFBE01076729.1/.p1  ORF type:complete len:396 (+),score=89.89 gb/GFBE01076729.1/:1-1188(+)
MAVQLQDDGSSATSSDEDGENSFLGSTPLAAFAVQKSQSGSNHLLHHDVTATTEDGEVIDYYEVSPDCWHMLFVSIVHDLPQIWQSRKLVYGHLLRAVFSALVNMAAVALQVLLIHYVKLHVVERQVNRLQADYRSFHAKAFTTEGKFIDEAWESFPKEDKDSLCESAIVHGYFIYSIVMVWTLRMLQEHRETYRLHRHILMLPDLPDDRPGTEMATCRLDPDTSEENWDIVSIKPYVRYMVYFLVLLPKYAINLYLLYAGTRWLAANQSFSDLILNCLALEFIIGIDEMLFAGLYPENTISELSRTALAISRPAHTPKERMHIMVQGYHRSLILAFLGFLWAYLYLAYFQQVIPGYNNDLLGLCRTFLAELETPPCSWSFLGCFPYGTSAAASA